MKAVMTIFLVMATLAAMAQNRKSQSKTVNITPEVKQQNLGIQHDSAVWPYIRQPVAQQNRKTRKPSARAGNVSGEKLDDLKNPFDTSKVKMVKQQVNQTGNESSNRTRQLNTGKPGRKNGLSDSSFIPVKNTESNAAKKSQDKPKEFKDTQFGAGAVAPPGNTPSTKRKRKGR